MMYKYTLIKLTMLSLFGHCNLLWPSSLKILHLNTLLLPFSPSNSFLLLFLTSRPCIFFTIGGIRGPSSLIGQMPMLFTGFTVELYALSQISLLNHSAIVNWICLLKEITVKACSQGTPLLFHFPHEQLWHVSIITFPSRTCCTKSSLQTS